MCPFASSSWNLFCTCAASFIQTLHAKYWLHIYDCLRDSTTTLLPTKLHDLNKRCRQGRQQMIKANRCEYEIIGIKVCLNINVVVFSDGDIPKWKTITKPMYNYTCTSCEMSNIVQCNFGYCNQKIFNQNNNFANMWKLFGSKQSQGMPLKLTRASLGHWAREKTEGPQGILELLTYKVCFYDSKWYIFWPTLTTFKLLKRAYSQRVFHSDWNL